MSSQCFVGAQRRWQNGNSKVMDGRRTGARDACASRNITLPLLSSHSLCPLHPSGENWIPPDSELNVICNTSNFSTAAPSKQRVRCRLGGYQRDIMGFDPGDGKRGHILELDHTPTYHTYFINKHIMSYPRKGVNCGDQSPGTPRKNNWWQDLVVKNSCDPLKGLRRWIFHDSEKLWLRPCPESVMGTKLFWSICAFH